MKRIGIIGAGDLGLQIAHYLKDSTTQMGVGFFDDYANQKQIEKTNVLGPISAIESLYLEDRFDQLAIGVGYKHMEFRKELFQRFNRKIPFASIVHESCLVDPTAVINAGAILFPNVHVDRNAKIENNVLINIGATVSHDSVVGSNCFISPRVAIAGFSNIGADSILGINSTVIDNVNICSNVQIGAGAVVTKSISQPGTYVGVPARFIQKSK